VHLGVSSARADKAPELVQLVMKLSAPGPDMVGQFVSETPTAITVIELKSGKERTADKKDVARVKRDLSDEDAIAGFGFGIGDGVEGQQVVGAVPDGRAGGQGLRIRPSI